MDDNTCTVRYIEIDPLNSHTAQSSDIPDCTQQSVQVKAEIEQRHSVNSDSSNSFTQQAVNETEQLLLHQRQNTARPFVWYKTPAEELASNDTQHDQTVATLNLLDSCVIQSETAGEQQDEDVLNDLFSRHSNIMGSEMRGSSCEVEIVREEDVDELYPCNTCDDADSIISIQKTHDNRCFSCKVCNKQFSWFIQLVEHMQTHPGVKPYKCNECDKSFHRIRSLKKHKRIHTRERPTCYCSYLTHIHSDDRQGSCCLSKSKYMPTYDLCKYIHSYKPFVCDICDRHFMKSSNLIQHKRTHFDIKPRQLDVQSFNKPFVCVVRNICVLCNRRFGESSDFTPEKWVHVCDKVHIHSDDRQDSCCVSKSRLDSTYMPKYDIFKYIHSYRPFVCDICDRHFMKSSNLIEHKRKLDVQSFNKPFVCVVRNICVLCNRRFGESSDFAPEKWVHVCDKVHASSPCSTVSSIIEHTHLQSANTGNVYQEAFCRFLSSFETPDCINPSNRHSVCTNDDTIECKTPAEELASNDTQHDQTVASLNLLDSCVVQSETASVNEDEDVLHCLYSQHSTAMGSELPGGLCQLESIHEVDVDKLYACSMCDKAYSDVFSLKKHEQIHTRNKHFLCEICSKQFTRYNDLVEHSHGQCDARLYKCGDCGRSFRRIIGLKIHKRIHTNNSNRHFLCTVCNTSFCTVTDLTQHNCTGEQYTCNQCDKTYALFNNFQQHKRLHFKEHLFACHMCDAVHDNITDLFAHRRVCSATKPYRCHICKETFARCSEVLQHKRDIHFDLTL